MGGRPRGGGGRAANPLLDGARQAMRGNGDDQPEMRNVTPGAEPSDDHWRCWMQLEAGGSGWNGPGPAPDKPGTHVPAHILAEFGYTGAPLAAPSTAGRAPAQRDEQTIRRSRFADRQPWQRERPQQAATAGDATALATQAVNRDRDREAAQHRANEALTTLMQQVGADVAMALDSDDFDAATEAEMQARGSAARTLAERAKAKGGGADG